MEHYLAIYKSGLLIQKTLMDLKINMLSKRSQKIKSTYHTIQLIQSPIKRTLIFSDRKQTSSCLGGRRGEFIKGNKEILGGDGLSIILIEVIVSWMDIYIGHIDQTLHFRYVQLILGQIYLNKFINNNF